MHTPVILRLLVAASALTLSGCDIETVSGPEPSPSPSGQGAQTAGLSGGAQNHSGGADARDAGRNPDAGAFGAACSSGTDCESNVCFVGAKGGSCSLTCAADADCPSGADDAAPHCNPRGYCRY